MGKIMSIQSRKQTGVKNEHADRLADWREGKFTMQEGQEGPPQHGVQKKENGGWILQVILKI